MDGASQFIWLLWILYNDIYVYIIQFINIIKWNGYVHSSVDSNLCEYNSWLVRACTNMPSFFTDIGYGLMLLLSIIYPWWLCEEKTFFLLSLEFGKRINQIRIYRTKTVSKRTIHHSLQYAFSMLLNIFSSNHRSYVFWLLDRWSRSWKRTCVW